MPSWIVVQVFVPLSVILRELIPSLLLISARTFVASECLTAFVLHSRIVSTKSAAISLSYGISPIIASSTPIDDITSCRRIRLLSDTFFSSDNISFIILLQNFSIASASILSSLFCNFRKSTESFCPSKSCTLVRICNRAPSLHEVSRLFS